jgi:hypothetical protein
MSVDPNATSADASFLICPPGQSRPRSFALIIRAYLLALLHTKEASPSTVGSLLSLLSCLPLHILNKPLFTRFISFRVHVYQCEQNRNFLTYSRRFRLTNSLPNRLLRDQDYEHRLLCP